MPKHRPAHARRSRARMLMALVAGIALVVVAVFAAATSGGGHGRSRPASKAASPSEAAGTSTSTTQVENFAGPDGVEAPWVVAENSKPGTTSWEITGTQSPTGIMGYSNRVQAQVGQSVSLYVSTQAPSFQVQAYRMGYYQGKGARLVWTSAEVPGVVQPACPVSAGINMVECHWPTSLSFTVDSSWVQGQYLLKLVGSAGQQSYVPLTIWDPSSTATYVVMSAVLTEQVFNAFGGYDLYQGATPCAANHYPCSTRARVVSFDRPYASGNGAGGYLSLMYPLTRLMEQHGLDVTYWTDITLDEHPNLLADHKVLISPGHDEEWSNSMRQAAVAGASAGVNLVFFGASPILRKVRLQASPLGADREVVNYRNPVKDPLYGVDNAEVTQNWWGQAPADLPASTLVGASYVGFNNLTSFPFVVSDPTSWLYAGTGLKAGEQIPGVMTSDFQAYDPSRSSNPPNVEILSQSPVTVQYNPSRHFADTVFYTMAASQAGVFTSGTVNWIPSLAVSCPATTTLCPSQVMAELTLNIMRVFGEGPVGRSYPSKANWQTFYG
ncbi:MAG: N,N-dimethylformamidase beta subunit family domain-containing protein [Acidimicrobiales bacterium]